MIYTLTFNPSLDYVVQLDQFVEERVNRTSGENIFPGGKGINVSIVLGNLGFDNTALGYIAGFTGDEIERCVRKAGCKSDFIRVTNGVSRINVKIQQIEKADSEINASGPDINEEEIVKLYKKLEKLQQGDTLILAGSVPHTLSDDIYMNLLEKLKNKDIRIIVDATGGLLKKTIAYKPFLIKPNRFEIEEIFGVTINSEEQLIECGKKLMDRGALNILISRGEKGAVFLCEDGRIISCKAPTGKVVNTVGAGDSMVAGFLAGYLEQKDYLYAFKMGIAAGSASAFSEKLATKAEIMKIFKELNDYIEY